MAEQENKETIVFLPWTVEPQPQTQSITLENPKEDKIHVDLAHSTDWVVATSIIVSGLISLFGFLVTVYVVRKSTQQNIQTNRELVEGQNNLKIKELNMIYRAQELAELRSKIQNYVSQGIRVRYFYSQSHVYSENSIFLEKDKSIFKKELQSAKIEFEVTTYNLLTYLDHFNELHRNIHLQMLDILSIVALMVENEQDKSIYDENAKKFISRFQKLQAILKTLLQVEAAHNKGESISL